MQAPIIARSRRPRRGPLAASGVSALVAAGSAIQYSGGSLRLAGPSHQLRKSSPWPG